MMCPPARLLATTTRVFTARANNGRRIEQRLGATDYSGRVRVLQFAARMRLARTLIGMVHLPPLPGSPRWDGSMERGPDACGQQIVTRSEEHTSELQSQSNLVCRLLLEKK